MGLHTLMYALDTASRDTIFNGKLCTAYLMINRTLYSDPTQASERAVTCHAS